MADPITWLAVGSAVLGATGAVSSANAQAASAQSAQNAAEYNAAASAQRATVAFQQGNANEEAQRRQAALQLGKQRAATAQSGVDLASGSALDLYQQSATNAELDALNIRYGAQLQAQGYQQQSTLDSLSAQQAGNNARSAMTAGYLNAGASALSAYGTYTNQKTQLALAQKGLK
ncbi:hypothetical protein E5S69_11610 [Cupriavidus necator]|uniref:hypothetical protein n=1 Tax=Cupriavidus necator TaxID=106590 RepID=UPI00148FBA16|nr:hypothetical protein [Cupriavidus necator]NOV24158.1 hypothetical protein [Cupriavidus necator]